MNENKCIEKLNNFLNNTDPKKKKLLNYWISQYVNYLDFEDKFKPQKLLRYKKGSIINVNLGFNVGSEEGGLHYCVVLEKNNSINDKIITVAPLTSLKSKTKVERLPKSHLYIGDELRQKILLKATSMHIDTNNKLERTTNLLSLYESSINSNELSNNLNVFEKNLNSLAKDLNELEKEQQYVQKHIDALSKMKHGSIILLNQVTTISKIRIHNPKSKYDVLNGIKLSETTLDRIDEKLKDFFFI